MCLPYGGGGWWVYVNTDTAVAEATETAAVVFGSLGSVHIEISVWGKAIFFRELLLLRMYYPIISDGKCFCGFTFGKLSQLDAE